jgi:hypothetical protein
MKASSEMVEMDIEDDSIARQQGRFDPCKTPYEIDEHDFPSTGPMRDQYMFLLRYAILAPSSHNAQPWKFLVRDNGVEVYADYTRRLPVADPGNREVFMSIGTALFNLRVAARHFGFECCIDYNHGADSDSPLAFVGLTRPIQNAGSSEPLFPEIVRRHTNRKPFLMARIADSTLAQFRIIGAQSRSALFISTDGKINRGVADLVAQADRVQQADPLFRSELAGWIRPNFTQKRDGMTGASFGASGMASILAPWATKVLDLGNIRATNDKNLCADAPGLIVIYSEDALPCWLEAGELLEHLLLSITKAGVRYSFFNMPIEIPELRIKLRGLLGLPAWPQLLLRIGYCLEDPVCTPRRSIEEVII